MIRFKSFLLVFFAGIISVSAQPAKNVSIINALIDESIDSILKSSPGLKQVSFEFNSPPGLKRFKNRVIYGLKSKGIEIYENDISKTRLNYALDDVSVIFSDAFRESFFGGYKSERKVNLDGSYIISENGKVVLSKIFSLQKTDTLDFDEIRNVSGNNFSMKGNDKPGVPFFGSLLEPVIALGAVAVAIFLFFTVRSN